MTDFVEEIERFLNSFSQEENAISRYAFRAILKGRAVHLPELPDGVGLSPAAIRTAVSRLSELGTLVVESESGQIVGVRGVSLVETPHSLLLDGRRLYAWCAVDAVGIPAALGVRARIESYCHQCQGSLSVEFNGDTLTAVPPGVVIWATPRDFTRSLCAYT